MGMQRHTCNTDALGTRAVLAAGMSMGQKGSQTAAAVVEAMATPLSAPALVLAAASAPCSASGVASEPASGFVAVHDQQHQSNRAHVNLQMGRHATACPRSNSARRLPQIMTWCCMTDKLRQMLFADVSQL